MFKMKIHINTNSFALCILAISVVTVLGSCHLKLNQEHPQITKGHKLYLKYCTECHAADGKGISDLREHYSKVDLTQINHRRNVEEFPIDEVAKYIDGRNHYKEFGPRPMPMWGVDLMSKEGNFDPDTARSNLAAIISYLITFQE